MAGDFNKPVTTDQYTLILQYVRENSIELAKMLNGSTAANIPSGANRLNLTARRFETYNGSSWAEAVAQASAAWDMRVAKADILTTARTISVAGDASGSASFNGSADVSITIAVADDSHNHTNATVSSLDAAKLTGTVADARMSGVYTNFSHKIDGTDTVFSVPSSGSQNTLGRVCKSVAQFRASSGTTTGAIVFTAPSALNDIMIQARIRGLLYNAAQILDIMAQGYYLSSAWSMLKKMTLGTVDVHVRFGKTPAGLPCIILGDVGSVWSYPHIDLELLISHTGAADAAMYGWTTALVTDLSAYTALTSNLTLSDSVTNISGLAATATKLATARNIALTGAASGNANFDGSGNISITLTLAAVAATNITEDATHRFITDTERTNWGSAYTHSVSAHAPSTAQKNSDITKAEIVAKLTGAADEHSHAVFTGELQNVDEKIQALGSISGTVNINLANGNIITATLAGISTISFSGWTSGKSRTFLLKLTNGGAYAITWGNSPKWPGGIAPTLTASGLDLIMFNSTDAGTTLHANPITDVK